MASQAATEARYLTATGLPTPARIRTPVRRPTAGGCAASSPTRSPHRWYPGSTASSSPDRGIHAIAERLARDGILPPSTTDPVATRSVNAWAQERRPGHPDQPRHPPDHRPRSLHLREDHVVTLIDPWIGRAFSPTNLRGILEAEWIMYQSASGVRLEPYAHLPTWTAWIALG